MPSSFSLRPTVRAAATLACFIALGSCTPIDAPPAVSNADGAVARPLDTGVGTSADPVIVAAGDIVCGNNTAPGTACKHALTANLIGSISPQAVLLLGDNQYEDGTFAEYNALYGPTWGVYKAITYPSVGNHEYQTANASGYFDYFNGVGVQNGRAGDRSKGYYSFDMGAWHLIALNSNCGSVGGCGAGSAQEVWLKADLLAHPNSCTLAFWHHPRFSSGAHGSDASTQALWQALYTAKADLLLTGHDHNYERFAPMTATGVLDNTNGLRSFVVGTGGKEQRSMGTTKANSLVRSNTSFGLLKLTLHPTSYDWQFVATAGGTLNDAGTSNCVGLPPGNQAPSASITSPAGGSSHVPGASVAFAGTGTDPEDGALTGSSLTWTSSINGAIGTGVAFSKSDLSLGTHTITLTATDAQGLVGTATRSITIAAASTNQKAVSTITSPGAGAVFLVGAPITFSGSCVDAEDGVLPPSAFYWTSNYGGGMLIGRGSPMTSSALAVGTHVISLLCQDSKGLMGSSSRTVTITALNQAPVATISSPPNGSSAVQGASITFAGTGLDPEQGALTGAALTWSSNIGGVLGTGTSLTISSLAVGNHTITLTAKDAQNAAHSVSITVTVTAASGNQRPVPVISSPSTGHSVRVGTNITFTGSATDPEDGAISSQNLFWTVPLNGGRLLGTGSTINVNSLPVGTHVVTLLARDSQNLYGSARVTVVITP